MQKQGLGDDFGESKAQARAISTKLSSSPCLRTPNLALFYYL